MTRQSIQGPVQPAAVIITNCMFVHTSPMCNLCLQTVSITVPFYSLGNAGREKIDVSNCQSYPMDSQWGHRNFDKIPLCAGRQEDRQTLTDRQKQTDVGGGHINSIPLGFEHTLSADRDGKPKTFSRLISRSVDNNSSKNSGQFKTCLRCFAIALHKDFVHENIKADAIRRQ